MGTLSFITCVLLKVRYMTVFLSEVHFSLYLNSHFPMIAHNSMALIKKKCVKATREKTKYASVRHSVYQYCKIPWRYFTRVFS